MLTALNHFVAHASCLELIGADLLGVAVFGIAIFLPVWIADHVSTVRQASRVVR